MSILLIIHYTLNDHVHRSSLEVVAFFAKICHLHGALASVTINTDQRQVVERKNLQLAACLSFLSYHQLKFCVFIILKERGP